MEVVEEGRGPKVLKSKSPKVSGSKGPEDQDISNANSNTSLTLKKVHLVSTLFIFSSAYCNLVTQNKVGISRLLMVKLSLGKNLRKKLGSLATYLSFVINFEITNIA